MSDGPSRVSPSSREPSLLYLATVSHTIRHFLLPYARHFRELGWEVSAAGSDGSSDPVLRDAFDNVIDLPLSRSIRDIGGLVRGERAIAKVLATGPDIVHVHTPIAAFLTRLAARRMPAQRRPVVVYTAHGFHFHRDGTAVSNAVFSTAERIAGRWTDRLIVINQEDDDAARERHLVPSGRLVRMPGIGIDTDHYSVAAVREIRDRPGAPDPALSVASPYFVLVGSSTRTNARPTSWRRWPHAKSSREARPRR